MQYHGQGKTTKGQAMIYKTPHSFCPKITTKDIAKPSMLIT